MVLCDLLKRETSSPPIIAVNNPAIGGNPDATAIPRLRGKAIRETLNPAFKSAIQFDIASVDADDFFIKPVME
jgi:hypothetical protein